MTARFRVQWTSSAVTGLAVSTVYSNAIDASSAEAYGDALQAFINQVVAEVGGASLSGVVQPLADIINPSTGAITNQVSISPPAPGVASAVDVGSKAGQVLIRFRSSTYLGGKRVQGHIFVPAVKKTAITANGDLASAFITSVNAAGSILNGTGNTVVYSRTNGLAVAVTSITTTSTLAVLRSRRD